MPRKTVADAVAAATLAGMAADPFIGAELNEEQLTVGALIQYLQNAVKTNAAVANYKVVGREASQILYIGVETDAKKLVIEHS
jgi:hypothetical protein